SVARQPADELIDAPPPASLPMVIVDLLGLGVFATIALVVIVQMQSLNAQAAVFPLTIAWAMLVLVIAAILQLVRTRQVSFIAVEGSRVRMFALPLVMLGAALLVPKIGFYAAALLLGLALMVTAQHQRISVRAWCGLIVGVSVTILGFSTLFSRVLAVPLP
ncbi:C4-dicarboxylate ABC transporter permease, partial [Gammaproteobacteria bacterium]|nr:C4-dicarboxylate ABC transporter permease [Gammaproteobacteria bacterium]